MGASWAWSASARMRIALDDLELDRLVVIYPGERSYPLGERVVVVPLGGLAEGCSNVNDILSMKFFGL